MAVVKITQKPTVVRISPVKFVDLGGGGVTIHNDLEQRDADDAHPQSAITGLTDSLETAQKAIAGIVDFDLTGVAGDTHTVTILPDHSGKTLDIRANLDDDVTVLVDNDIVLKQPITIWKEGEFTLLLRAATEAIMIKAIDVIDDAGFDQVDISGDLFHEVQIIKISDNVIRGIGI